MKLIEIVGVIGLIMCTITLTTSMLIFESDKINSLWFLNTTIILYLAGYSINRIENQNKHHAEIIELLKKGE